MVLLKSEIQAYVIIVKVNSNLYTQESCNLVQLFFLVWFNQAPSPHYLWQQVDQYTQDFTLPFPLVHLSFVYSAPLEVIKRFWDMLKIDHKVFRRTINKQGEEMFLEIHHIPLVEESGEVNLYIQIIEVCSVLDKGKVLSIQTPEQVLENVQFAIVQLGDLGGEIVTTDKLSFVESNKLEEFLIKITVYIFGGLIQGVEDQIGLFGPLPVLDKTEYEMLAYLFQIRNDLALDPRKKGIERCMLLIFLKREYNFIFEKRELIANFLAEKVDKWGILQNITPEEHEIFATELRSFLKQQIM